ncbi:polyprenyl synthetase family protein [Streptomyces sp. SCSIO 30461]|uniref:polyprenyl synthetase family protein n=1 Tax=Streptomyces sp. SCSIO 30461 TaxID=3118085 RepID=UPI0030D2D76F
MRRVDGHRRRFDAHFEAYFDSLARHIDTPPMSRFTPRCLELLRDLSLRGGNRLRVALLYEAARLVTGGDVPGLEPAALSVELLQTHGLIHDDIIDDSPVRRGGPSTYYAYRDEHPDRPRTALGLAVLAGDLAAFLSVRVLLDADLPVELRQSLMDAHLRAATETVTGQVVDLERDLHAVPGEDLLHTVTDFKSARYSILAPLRMGLLVVGEDPAPYDRTLSRYARLAGIGGQLRDDYLDLFGTEETQAKSTGSDIRSGRRSYAVSAVLAAATQDESDLVESALGDPRCPDETIECVRAIARRHGVDDRLRADMRRHAEAAAAETDRWPCHWRPEAVGFFRQLPLWAVSRLA